MGEYVIGPGFCPQLLGHPDILYRYQRRLVVGGQAWALRVGL